MRLLLDTHLLLWALGTPERLSSSLRAELEDPDTKPLFSAASLWEIVIKSGLGRRDFKADARLVRAALGEAGYTELAVTGAHAVAVASLPPLHKDPFDRILLAQASVENMELLTADRRLAGYPGPVRLV